MGVGCDCWGVVGVGDGVFVYVFFGVLGDGYVWWCFCWGWCGIGVCCVVVVVGVVEEVCV